MNLREQDRFYNMMTRLRGNSRTASTTPMVTEITDGLIVTRPAKKIEYLSEAQKTEKAQVWNLTKDGPVLQSKAASVPGINKLKVIRDFIRSNGRF